MQRLLFWLKGYVVANINGNHIERFINITANHGINLYDLNACEDGYRFRISRKEYVQLLPVIRKTKCRPYIIAKKGGYFTLIHIMNHTAILPGLLLFLFLLYFLSLFLWDIQFTGNHLHTEEQLLRFVNEKGIGFGSRCNMIDCADLESEIREHFPDIGWVSAELKGSRMVIRIQEANFREVRAVQTEDKSHIIADYNGVVEKIIVRNGVPLKKPGDTVKKGEILISGIINMNNEYDEPLSTVAVAADGEIALKCKLHYEDTLKRSYIKQQITGKQKYGFTLGFGNRKIFSYIPSIPYDKYDIISKTTTWKLSKNLYLLFNHTTISCMEYQEYEAFYGDSELKEKGLLRYLLWLEQIQKQGAEAIEDEMDFRFLNQGLVISGEVTVIGPYWVREKFIPEEGVSEE